MTMARDRLLPGKLAITHLVADMALLFVTLAWVSRRYVEPAYFSTHDWAWVGVIMAAVWGLLGMVLRHYGEGPVRQAVEDAAVVSLLVGASCLLLAATRMAVPTPAALPPVEPFILLLWPISTALRVGVFRGLQKRSGPSHEVLIVGVGPLARATARYLAVRAPRCRIVGHVPVVGERVPGYLVRPVVSRWEDLGVFLQRRSVDEVYIAVDPCSQASQVQSAVLSCERLGIPFALPIPPIRLERARPTEPMVGGPVSLDGYVHFSPTPSKPYQLAMKRLIDVSVAGAALLFLSPAVLLLALAIKVSSPGPVLFRQHRIGLHGRAFGMLKFRSMYQDAEERREALEAKNEQAGPVFKIKHDPRVTPLGRFIRKYSIDELPQLLNVLKGEMSLVGPRPPLPREVDQYHSWQRRRLSVRPGLTCIWQVSGRNEISFDEWMRLDMRYIDHWALSSDLSLILKTIPVVVTGKGAS